jgi:spore maturation protein A
MVMSWIFTVLLALSAVSAMFLGNGQALGSACVSGAQNGITLAVSIAGSLCLWTGIGKLMERIGITSLLAKLLRPVLHRLFPSTKTDLPLASSLSANICANFLGLGNAATPMGIQAAKRLVRMDRPGVATNELCRLIVLNTASIQLIPANVAAIRTSLGCNTPFDILPAVWVTSLLSAGAGVAAAYLMERVWGDA